MVIVYAGFGLSFLLNGYLTRHLGLDGLGDFRVALGVAGIASAMILFGGQAAARRFIPQYLKDRSWGEVKGFIIYYLRLCLILGAVAAALSLSIAYIFEYLNLDHLEHEAYFAIILTPLVALSMFFGAIIQSMKRTVAGILPHEVLKPGLFWLACVTWLIFYPTFDEYQAVSLFFVTSAIVVAVQWVLLADGMPFKFRGLTTRYEQAQWNKVGVPLLYSALANSFLVRIDVFALEILHTDENSIGVFSLLVFVASFVWLNFSSISNVISPRVAELDHDRAGLQKLFDRTLLTLGAANCVAAVGIGIFATPILAWFHGDLADYRNWLYVILAGAVVNCTLESASPFLRFGGHQDKAAKVARWVLLTNVIVTPLAILLYGLEGALIALVATRFLRGMGYMVYMRMHMGIRLFGRI